MDRNSTNQLYHKKRKKGIRLLVDKRKNSERQKQQPAIASKENVCVSSAILPVTSIASTVTSTPSILQADHLCLPHLHRQPLVLHQQICNSLIQVPTLPQQSSCISIPLPTCKCSAHCLFMLTQHIQFFVLVYLNPHLLHLHPQPSD